MRPNPLLFSLMSVFRGSSGGSVSTSRWFTLACVWGLVACTGTNNFSGTLGPRLTVELAGNGVGFVTSTPAGINCPGTCERIVPAGTEVTLEASPSVAGTTFVGWSGPCSGLDPCRVNLQLGEQSVVIAAFALRNSLVVTRVGTGSGTVRSEPAGIDCGDDCAELFPPQTEVTLTAAPGPGSTFEGWSGACAGQDTCVVSAAQAQLVTATFAAVMVPLTVDVLGMGQGSVVSTPPGLTCSSSRCVAPFEHGKQVTLRASNATGSNFMTWGGACAGSSPTCTLTLTGPTSVTARFEGSLAITPSTATLTMGQALTFVASGGVAPYVFSVRGRGAIDQSGRYTAPFVAAVETVVVTDARGSSAEATVRVTGPALALFPATKTLARGETFTFVAVGGVPPYVFSISPTVNNGTIDQLGHYTAPPFDTTAVVRVTDAMGALAEAVITVRGLPLTVTPASVNVFAGSTVSFTAAGGQPPYAFVVLAGPGSIFNTGLYMAPPFAGQATVRVTDSAGAFADAQVNVRVVGDGGVIGDAGVPGDAGFFAPAASISIGLVREIISGDWNGDGQTDVAVTDDASLHFAMRVGNTFLVLQSVSSFGAHPLAGDWNLDGKLDVAAGEAANPNGVRVMLGGGNGTFLPAGGALVDAGFPDGGSLQPFTDSTTADFNRDGLPDLALSLAFPGGLRILLGRGDGTFQPPTLVSSVGDCFSVTSGDWNRDGRVDLALACSPSAVKVLLGVGDGTFGAAVDVWVRLPAAVVGPNTVTAGELNADGVPDLVVSSSTGEVIRFLGLGDGTFSSPLTVSPVVEAEAPTITIGDWNDDGRTDLAVARTASDSIELLFGNGDGTFRSSTVPYPSPEWITSLDWNHDGRPDLVVANTSAFLFTVLVNESPHVPPVFQRRDTMIGNQPFWLLADDWNRDGKADLSVTESTGSGVLLGRGDGTFGPTQTLAGGAPSVTASGDWNRDGKPDVAVAAASVTLFLGDGDGGFATGASVDGGDSTRALITDDWNRDGKPDLATSDFVNGTRLFLGAGDGTFSAMTTPLDAGVNVGAVVSADWNRDGAPDLALANQSSNAVTVLLGRGDGTFQAPVSYATGSQPFSVCTSDLNRDGKLDLVVPLASNSVAILRGVGDGTFVAQAPLQLGRAVNTALCGNWNADGWPDIAVATPGTLTFFMGVDGNTFSPLNLPLSGSVGGLTSADWNGDGKPDLAVTQPPVNTITFFLSN